MTLEMIKFTLSQDDSRAVLMYETWKTNVSVIFFD